MLKIYNTLARKKEIFKPRKNKLVNLFVCGPTVYDFSHIGHARTYIFFDVFVKYLREKGYKVFYLQNITDIDDKIINRAKEEKISWKKLSRKFEKEYLKDVKSLGINSVTKYARATDHIKEIISQVKRLIQKNYAYKTTDGIYYDISKFKEYGKLSKRTVLQAQDAISRIDDSVQKRNKGDFCLWKFTSKQILTESTNHKKNLYEPSWPSPFGPGRPGWHIEDTAITEKYFGPQYDIHGGAIELSFPHHEAEIAQMEAISGKKPLVKYWLHTGLLTINGQKMSKSLKNFIAIREFLNNYSARTLRLFVLTSHYRSPIDYNQEKIEQTKNQLDRIDEFIDKLKKVKKSHKEKKSISENLLSTTKKRFEIALEDDFNLPKAMGILFKLIKKVNILLEKEQINKIQAEEILNFFKKIDKFLGIIFFREAIKIPPEIKELIKKREKARKEKNWQLADEIREKIKAMGYSIQDTPKGPHLKKL